MNVAAPNDALCKRPTNVAFVHYADARTVGLTVYMTPDEERRLRDLLAALHDYGLILRASFVPALPHLGFREMLDVVRQTVGAHFVDAALLARGPPPVGSDPEPAAVMPVWAFEPEGNGADVLISSGRLWGADLLLEALRVESDDDPVPMPSVRARYARWNEAAGAGSSLKTTELPGRRGAYAIFAAPACA